jgi:hypothetical protein
MVTLWRASHSKSQLKSYSFVEHGYPFFMTYILKPLIDEGHEIDVYMITHEFNHPNYESLKKDLINTCPNFNIYFTNQMESPRLPYTYLNILRKVIATNKKYNRYIITRGDLYYKNRITDWMPAFSQKDVCWFLFKDHKKAWEEKRLICDIMFIIDGNLEKFKKAVSRQIEMYPERTELHGIYYILKENFGENVNCVVDGFFDSNTSKKIRESNNPVYIMINRPYFFDENGVFKNLDHEPILSRKMKRSVVEQNFVQFKFPQEKISYTLQKVIPRVPIEKSRAEVNQNNSVKNEIKPLSLNLEQVDTESTGDNTSNPQFIEEKTQNQIVEKKEANESQAFEQPKIDRPVFEQPRTDRPVFEQPRTDRPVFEQPRTDRPVFEQPRTDRPVFEQPRTDRPVFEQPKIDRPVFEQPRTEKVFVSNNVDIRKIYQQRIHEKIERQKQHKAFLAEHVPEKISSFIKKDRK